jgi:hypothetical protein
MTTFEVGVEDIEVVVQQRHLLVSAATARDFELDSERMSDLIGLARSLQSQDTCLDGIYSNSGLTIGIPCPVRISGVPPGQISVIDFTPTPNGEEKSVCQPRRDKTTEITLVGIRAFQDFILLADAGLALKPDMFFGTTNETMGRIAERLGFEPTPKMHSGVIADYDDVGSQLFSVEIKELQQRLERRLEKSAGSLATQNRLQ